MPGASKPNQSASIAGVETLLATFQHSGRPDDFAQIVHRFAAIVYAECRRVTRDAHDAEDAAQLTFLAFAIELRTGKQIDRPIAWLQRVAKRQSLKIVRSRGRRKKREDAVRREIDPAAPQQDIVVDDQTLTASLVRDAIDSLPERYRLPLVLHYFGGLSLESIAKELRLTRTAVGTRLHRGRKLVADALEARGLTFDAGVLTGVIASLVPFAVVTNLVSCASIGPATHSAGLAASVCSMLQATSHIAGTRVVTVAAIALALGGSAMGWRALPAIVEELREQFQFSPFFHRLFTPSRFVPAPIASTPAPPTDVFRIDPIDSLAFASAILPAAMSDTRAAPRLADPIQTSASNTIIASAPIPAPAKLSDLVLAGQTIRSDSSFELAPVGARVSTLPQDRSITTQADRAAPRETSKRTRPVSSIDPEAEMPREYDSMVLGGGGKGPRHFFQSGGEVQIGRLVIGDANRGEYVMNRGRLEVGQLTIGKHRGSRGRLSIGNGEVRVTDPLVPIEIGAQGSGVVYLGTQDEPGSLVTANGAQSRLIIRASEDARGVIRGWGDVESTGIMINNGRVIADGFDHLRSLNFDSFTRIENTIDNPREGSNGWFAQRGGRVQLPAISVEPGTHTYTWGESTNDPTIDLVNSVRFTVHGQAAPASLAINLRTVALADPLDIPLPTEVALFGLWEIKSAQLDPSAIDLMVRYNGEAASAFGYGEIALRLLAYTDTGWQSAEEGWIDLSTRIIGGRFEGGIQYFAVALDWNGYPGDWYRSGVATGSTFNTMNYARVVPEPMGLVLVMGVIAFSRRRRSIA